MNRIDNRDKVTRAWQRIHAGHPEIHTITNPRFLSRMKHRDFTKAVLAACNLDRGSAVLEAGCGSGRDILYFSFLGHQCSAVDISNSPLEKLMKAKKELALDNFGQPVQLDVRQADIFQLPYADSIFDIVFNSGVIEHYVEETRCTLLKELSRVVKPGGFLTLLFPNKDHILEKYWRRIIGAWTDYDTYDIAEQPLGEAFVSGFRHLGLDVVLYDRIDCYDTISHYPNWLLLRLIAYTATTCLPRPPRGLRKRFGTRSIVIARKTSN